MSEFGCLELMCRSLVISFLLFLFLLCIRMLMLCGVICLMRLRIWCIGSVWVMICWLWILLRSWLCSVLFFLVSCLCLFVSVVRWWVLLSVIVVSVVIDLRNCWFLRGKVVLVVLCVFLFSSVR